MIVYVTLKSEMTTRIYEGVSEWDFVERGNKWFLYLRDNDKTTRGRYTECFIIIDDIIRISIER